MAAFKLPSLPLNKSGSAMRTYVDFHLFLIMNDGMSQCTVSFRPS